MNRVAGLSFAMLAAIAILVAGPRPASADLLLSAMILDFEPGSPPRRDVELFNNGVETLFVETRVFEVEYPGTEAEARMEVRDPQAIGMLVSPNRVILPPGERRTLRFVLLTEPGPVERIYRVTVTPVVGGVEGEATGLKIILAYEMLVIVRPAEMNPELAGRREGRLLRLENTGNTNILIEEVRQCPGSADCSEVPGMRLYPGQEAEIELPLSGVPAEVTQQVGGWTNVVQF